MRHGSLFLSIAIIATVAPLAIGSATAAAQSGGQIVAIGPTGDAGATVVGWACEPNGTAPLLVQFYVGDSYPAGQLVATTRTDAAPASGDCAGGTRHAFSFRLGLDTLFRYGGLRLFVYASAAETPTDAPLVAPADATVPLWTPVGASPRTCDVLDIASLKSCVAHIGQLDRLSLHQDLTCASTDECCGPGKAALIDFSNVAGRVFDGNGHTIHRAEGARECRAIAVNNSSDVLLRNLSLDEGEQVPPCDLSVQNCPNTIAVNMSRNVRVDDTHIYFGKGYVIYVWGTDGFVFTHSSLSESGIIGLYVGHYKFARSKNVVIANSIFARSRTSGLAIQGAYGADPANPVLIINNVFTRNHWHGLWRVPGVVGGITAGGQVLIADGANIRFTDNIVADGACDNCYPPGQTVGGVEIGDDAHPPAGVSNLDATYNYIYAFAGNAFGQNPGTPVSGVTVKGNRLAGRLRLDTLAAVATRTQNTAVSELPQPGNSSPLNLSLAPRLGASTSPIYRCLRNGAEVYSRTQTCDGDGQIVAVLGFPYESFNPDARPFFACQLARPGAHQVLSMDPNCEGGRTIAQLGFAIPK